MPFLYHKIQRKNPQDRGAAPLWYLSRVSTGRATVDVISKRVARLSGHSFGVVKGVLHDLLEISVENLKAGNNVQIGDLGTCRLVLRTEGAETEDVFKLNSMKRGVKCVFIPSPTLKQAISLDTVQLVSSEAAVTEEPVEPQP